jgi:hypothetical protein
MFTSRLGALPIAFRVAGFGRADRTLFPRISPASCERCTALLLANCKRVYFLSDLTMRAAHSTVRANASHTVRLMALAVLMLRAPKLNRLLILVLLILKL